MLSLIIIMLLTAVFCCYSFGYVTHPRLAYYKALLDNIRKSLDSGFCGESKYVMGVDIYFDNMRKNAPELLLFNPAVTYGKDY